MKDWIWFTGMLTIVFIILKLTGVIDRGWLYVLMPKIISIAVWIVLWIVALIVVAIEKYRE